MPQSPDAPRRVISLQLTAPTISDEDRRILETPSLQALALDRLYQAEKFLLLSTTIIPPKLLQITEEIQQATEEYDARFGGTAIVQGIAIDEEQAREAQRHLISLATKKGDITIFNDTKQTIRDHFETIRRVLRKSIELFGPIEIPPEMLQELVGKRVRSTVDALGALGDVLELVATQTASAHAAGPEAEPIDAPRTLDIPRVIELTPPAGRKKRERAHEIVMPGVNESFESWMQITGIPHPPMKDTKAKNAYYARMQNFRVALGELARKVPSFSAYLRDELTEVTAFHMILHLHTLTALDLLAFKPEAKQARSDSGIAPVSRLLFLLHRDMLRREKGTDVSTSDIGTPEVFRELAMRILNAEIEESEIRDVPLVEPLITEFLKDPNARSKIVIHSPKISLNIRRSDTHAIPRPADKPSMTTLDAQPGSVELYLPQLKSTIPGVNYDFAPVGTSGEIQLKFPDAGDITKDEESVRWLILAAIDEMDIRLAEYKNEGVPIRYPSDGIVGDAEHDSVFRIKRQFKANPYKKFIKEFCGIDYARGDKTKQVWTEEATLMLIIIHHLSKHGGINKDILKRAHGYLKYTRLGNLRAELQNLKSPHRHQRS